MELAYCGVGFVPLLLPAPAPLVDEPALLPAALGAGLPIELSVGCDGLPVAPLDMLPVAGLPMFPFCMFGSFAIAPEPPVGAIAPEPCGAIEPLIAPALPPWPMAES